ncbi:MAG: lipid-A-disaccharide synthase, partial [Bdellovibrionota bacterium]
SEVLARLPRILRAMNRLVEAARREKPDVAVLLDYPDFHLRLAPRLRALGIPLVYYIPPKVWIWRRSRVKRIRELFSRVLSIFPMEEEFLRKHHVPVVYVGNPLLDELPFQRTRGEARRALGLSETERTLVMMPGSRPAEIRMLLERMLDSAEEARKRLAGELTVLLPFAENANLPELDERVKLWKRSREAGLQIRLSRGNAHECLIAADAGLIKSGTSTLEAALLGCPHSITYRFNALSSWLFYNLVRYRGPVGLSNILFGWEKGKPLLVHEVVLKDATVSQLSAEIVTLFTDEEYRRRMKEGFATLREKLSGPGTSPSSEAARQILEVAQ